jgi:hypothetical protein
LGREEKVKELLKLKVILCQKKPKITTTVPVRVQYVRYADDWIVGVNGPAYLAQEVKSEISDFLANTLGLKLSEEKTKITYVRTNFVI